MSSVTEGDISIADNQTELKNRGKNLCGTLRRQRTGGKLRQNVGISGGITFEQKGRTDMAAHAVTAPENGPIYDPGIVPNDVRRCVPA